MKHPENNAELVALVAEEIKAERTPEYAARRILETLSRAGVIAGSRVLADQGAWSELVQGLSVRGLDSGGGMLTREHVRAALAAIDGPASQLAEALGWSPYSRNWRQMLEVVAELRASRERIVGLLLERSSGDSWVEWGHRIDPGFARPDEENRVRLEASEEFAREFVANPFPPEVVGILQLVSRTWTATPWEAAE